MTKFSLLNLHYVVSVKSMMKISSIVVAFLENTNFTFCHKSCHFLKTIAVWIKTGLDKFVSVLTLKEVEIKKVYKWLLWRLLIKWLVLFILILMTSMESYLLDKDINTYKFYSVPNILNCQMFLGLWRFWPLLIFRLRTAAGSPISL